MTEVADAATGAFHDWPVPAALRPYVSFMVGYDYRSDKPGVHQGLPSTALTMVVALDEPLDVGWADNPDSRVARWSLVSGLHTSPAQIHHPGYQRGVQLGLTLAGSRELCGLPAAVLAREIVAMEDLGGLTCF